MEKAKESKDSSSTLLIMIALVVIILFIVPGILAYLTSNKPNSNDEGEEMFIEHVSIMKGAKRTYINITIKNDGASKEAYSVKVVVKWEDRKGKHIEERVVDEVIDANSHYEISIVVKDRIEPETEYLIQLFYFEDKVDEVTVVK